MAKNIIAKFKNRADTSTNWAIANPILELGELGLETDTNKIKFGDGVTTWNSLVYYSYVSDVEKGIWNNKADKAYVDDIEVGGRNYFSNSDFREGMNVYWELLNSSPSSNFEINGGELKVTFNAGTNSDFGTMNFLSQNNLEGQDYITVSSLVRGSGTLRIRFGGSTMPMQAINNTQFKRVFFTIPRANFGNGNLILEIASGVLYFYKIKAETGNKATDWTPSPEEVEGLINNKVDTDTVTTINGKTGSISKADIVALGLPAQDTVYTHPANHPASIITGLPNSLPADGGNADTVNGLTVLTAVPLNAKFTDTNTITTINGKTGAISKADIVALGIPASDTNTTYGVATTTANGLMLATDKSKLNGIATGANNYVHPAGTNPHGTTKSNVGLGSVLNYGIATQTEAQAGTSNSKYMTPLRTANAINIHKGETVSQLIYATRDLSLTGSQTITGFTGKPKRIDIVAINIGLLGQSNGFCDSDGIQGCFFKPTERDGYYTSTDKAITLGTSSSNFTSATINIITDNSITLNWAKTGTGGPGTANIYFMAHYHG